MSTESWRNVWRKGFIPSFSDAHLQFLRDALASDDPKLTQGSTTTPPPLMCVQDWPVEAACALGFCGWQGDELESVGQVEEFFARVCFEADQRLGEPAACRWFLNWFDDTPRDEMRRELLAEVTLALEERNAVKTHKYPAGSVVVSVPRSELPEVFAKYPEYENPEPFHKLDTYNLVIVSSGTRVRAVPKELVIEDYYTWLYSCKSGRMYEWDDYYAAQDKRVFAVGVDVESSTVLVSAVPPENYHNPPKAVNLYLSTAGVAWLALRTVLGDVLDAGSLGRDAQRLVSLEDAPFGTYFDLLDELEGHDSIRERLRTKLSLFFGLKS